MKISNVILGGGMVGRIVSYKTGYPIVDVTDNRDKDFWFQGLFYLHTGQQCRVMLSELGLPIDMREVRSGIIIGGHTITSDIPRSAIDDYCIKTRGVSYIKLNKNDAISVMSGLLKHNRYTCSPQMLWDELYDKTFDLTISGIQIDGINYENKFLKTRNSGLLFYDCAINTMPLPVFASYPSGLTTGESKTWCLEVDDIPENIDYLYIVDKGIKATRISFPANMFDDFPYSKNIVLLETKSSVVEEELYGIIQDIGFDLVNSFGGCRNKMKHLGGNSEHHLDKLESANVKSMGRYARWDNSILISDVIGEVCSGQYIKGGISKAVGE